MSTPLLAELQKLRPDLVVGDVLTAAGGLSAERLGVPWVQLCTIRCTCPRMGCRRWAVAWRPAQEYAGHCGIAYCRRWLPGRPARRAATVGGPIVGGHGGARSRSHRAVGRDVARTGGAAAGLAGELSRGRPVVVGPCRHRAGAAAGRATPGDRVTVDRSGGNAGDARCRTERPRRGPGGGHRPAGARCRLRTAQLGVPAVLVPGGGDQWELANRAVRQGCAVIVRPLTPKALDAAVHRVLDDPSFAAASRRAADSTAEVTADAVTVCQEAVSR